MAGLTDQQRFAVSTTDVWNCPNAFEVVCPKRWAGLVATADPGVRHCRACDRPVYRCETPAEFVARGGRGDCVAVPAGYPPLPGFGLELLGRPSRERVAEFARRAAASREWWAAVVATEPGFAVEAIAEVARALTPPKPPGLATAEPGAAPDRRGT